MSESTTAITGVMIDSLTGEISVERAAPISSGTPKQPPSAQFAAHTGPRHASLYPVAMLGSVIEENRHRAAVSGSLIGLTDEIATVRAAIDILAPSVRRHEEQLRKDPLERAKSQPANVRSPARLAG